MSHRSEPDPIDLDLIEFEHALGSLTPSPSRLDRDRLMFQAGRSSQCRPAPRGQGRWRAAAVGFALLALGEAAFLASGRPTRIVERVVVVHAPAPHPSATPAPSPAPSHRPASLGPSRSLGSTPTERLASQLLRYGLDGLPSPMIRAAGPLSDGPVPSAHQWLQAELHQLLEPGGPS